MISLSKAPSIPKRRSQVATICALLIILLALLHWSYATRQHIPRLKSLFSAQAGIEEIIDNERIEYVHGSNEDSQPFRDVASLPSLTAAISTPPSTTTKAAAVTQIGAIIAAARATTNLTWMYELEINSWRPYPYNVDDPSPPPELYIPANKGHEAMVYLSWIIDNYNQLPLFAVFTHGHQTSWHQEGNMVELISSMRLAAVRDAGYISLRCHWYPSCPREIRPITHDAIVWGPGINREATEYEISRVWGTLFPDEPMPETIASQCCAQFAVTKDAIHSRGKEEYERMRQFILDSELPDDVSGRVLEKLWAYVFTKEPVRCPPPQRCACEYFGQCEPKAWLQTPDGLPDIPPW